MTITKGYDFTDFHEGTAAIWTPWETPTTPPDYVSTEATPYLLIDTRNYPNVIK